MGIWLRTRVSACVVIVLTSCVRTMRPPRGPFQKVGVFQARKTDILRANYICFWPPAKHPAQYVVVKILVNQEA